MRYKVFLDTNILISGIFFEGNESKILDLVELDLITCEDVVEELEKPDYFLTGDTHFHVDQIKRIVNVVTTKDFLDFIR